METLNTLPTYKETFSHNFQLIHEDLQITLLTKITYLGSPYDDTITIEMKFSLAYRMLLRAKQMNNRVLILSNAFYIGKLLKTQKDPII